MERFPNCWRSVLCALVLVLAEVPALAGDEVIESGVDLWVTAGDELSFTSFGSEPIPAGFFCAGSEPFSDKVTLRGRPLATEPAGSLGAVDTVVHRLDDAVFDADEIARTRIRLMALSMVATEPIETSCGRYDVAVALAGEQPVTEMKIYRTSRFGGVYRAPLALDVEMTFTPVEGHPHPPRSLARRVDLGPGTQSVWSYRIVEEETPVRVDTDGDRVADAALPSQGNFLAGVAASADGPRRGRIEFAATETDPGPQPVPQIPQCSPPLCPYEACHCTPLDEDPEWDEPGENCSERHLHCTWVCAPVPGCVSQDEV